MSLGSFTSSVITLFKADTKDMEAGLKRLTGLEKEQQKAQLEATKERNTGYDQWIKKLGDTNQALELAGKAVGFAKDAFTAYSEDLRMRAAAGTVSIDKLKAASLGLRTEHELLTFAAQTQHGAFKLTEEQMATAQKAMVALTRAGFDQEEVTKKVTDALVKGKAEGLDDFGISIKSTGSQVGDFNALMTALANKASGVKDGTRTAAEGIQAMGTSMHDSMARMKESIGKLVVAMGPLLNALAHAVELIAQIAAASGAPTVEGVQASVNATIKQKPDSNAAFLYRATHGGKVAPGAVEGPSIMDAAAKAYANGLSASVDANWVRADGSVDEAKLATWLQTNFPQTKAKSGSGGSVGSSDYFGGIQSAIRVGMTDAIAALNTGTGKIGTAAGGVVDASNERDRRKLEDHEAYQSALKEMSSDLAKLDNQLRADALKQRETTFLESTFGKLDDFNAYSTAFNMLTGSVSAAMDAWITGSMTTGQAIKKFLADALKGLAIQMGVESIKHGAYALGSLAFGDVGGATRHGIAAAEFAAGALAAGVAAKQLGAGGTAVAKGGGSASASTGARSQADAGSTPGSGSHGNSGGTVREIHTFTYLDPFASQNETQRREYAQRMVNKAVEQASARR